MNLADRVKLSFSRLGYCQLNGVEIDSDGNHVVLFGKLDSYYLKQIAQTVPRLCLDVVLLLEPHIIHPIPQEVWMDQKFPNSLPRINELAIG